jgi:hypothetical protein
MWIVMITLMIVAIFLLLGALDVFGWFDTQGTPIFKTS